jgi:hypothetical protein
MNFLIDIFMHTGLFVITIPLFYFYFVTTTVNSAITDNIVAIAKQRIQQTKINTALKKTDVQNIFNALNQQLVSTLSDFSIAFTDLNKLIKTIAFSVTGLISVSCLIIGISLCLMYNVSIYKTLISNLIVLSFILLSEFLIVIFFLNKLELIDGDFLQATLIYSLYSNPDTVGKRYASVQCEYMSKVFPLNLKDPFPFPLPSIL